MFDRWCWCAAVCLGMGLVAGCGSVDNSTKDAKVDSPKMQSDSAIDSSLPAKPTAVGASNITQFTIANGTFAPVTYSPVDYDDLGEYTAATGTFAPKGPGDYRICASLYFTNATTVPFELDLFKNNTRDHAIAYGTEIAAGCGVIRVGAGDTLQVRATQNSGNNVTPTPEPNWQWLSIDRVTTTAAVLNTATTPAQAGTFVKVPYASEEFDDGGQFDAATSKFVATVAGDFELCAGFDLGSASYSGELDLYKKGSRERALRYNGQAITGCRTLRLAATDDVAIYLDHPATVTVGVDTIWGWLRIQAQPTTSVSVTGISAFSATANTFTKVQYSVEQIDTNSEFDIATNTFTASAAGDYQVCASILTQNTIKGEIDIYKNGVREKGLFYGPTAQTGCRTVRLAANDQIQIYYDGPAVSFQTDANWDWFEVTKVH